MFVSMLSKSIFLLVSLVISVCGVYPFALWIIGQTIFPFQANGSIIYDADNKAIGSKIIAQPFTKDEYFQPRPSAAAYDASASASSALAASNYALRDRISRTLGSIVKYQNGQSVASDIEKWFQQDRFQKKPNIVAQWVTLHTSLAQAWVNANPAHGAYVDAWSKSHSAAVSQYIKDNPKISTPKSADLAIVFFQNFSKENPGKFPVIVVAHGESSLKPMSIGSAIQSTFFDMWRQDHPDVVLQDVPGDLVTTSASGLDPHISLQNAQYQLDRVAKKWANNLKRNPDDIRKEIEQLLQNNAASPFGGLAGEKFVNVLEVNLELHKHYGSPP